MKHFLGFSFFLFTSLSRMCALHAQRVMCTFTLMTTKGYNKSLNSLLKGMPCPPVVFFFFATVFRFEHFRSLLSETKRRSLSRLYYFT
ncbi:hypothetical protein STCU_10376 [Strigomonas culicis]|uniref:Secreted protein n=1 Tax=Strigomonas culicis TaxID=28005 RepID=S9V4M9_9TRYP|nr:hypothetical protein STCU_10376 [Strigomonas culicis]|eukprot:EPY17840.1 hypothetical protein STCU_10376 [Strigomonas culicis]